jgi:hypothetical protein
MYLVGDSWIINNMLTTRSLIFATAASLLGAGFVATSSATAGPVPCTTKKCVDQPPPRLCSDVQAELDQVNMELWGPPGSNGGLYYSVSMGNGFTNLWAGRLATATADSVRAQQVLADVIASAPAYAEGVPAVDPNAGSGGLFVTLDRQTLWEQQLGEAQAEVARLAAIEADAFTRWSSYSSGLPAMTALLNAAIALQQTLLGEFKTCTYRIG